MTAVIDTFRARDRALRRARRVQTALGSVLFATACLAAAATSNFNPVTLAEGIPRLTEYLEKTLPVLRADHIVEDIGTWFYGIGTWLDLLVETVLMAYLATLLGTAGAIVLCFTASANLARRRWTFVLTRRFLEFCRTIPDIVFALIFVFAFGLGPMAGILAIAIHSMGASGKLFAEANENIDRRPVEGLTAAGASWAETMRYAVLPQVLPNYATFTLWRFEINVRSAAAMGFVGAGGIGLELVTAIRSLYYEDISAIILMIIVTVSLIDIGCERLRHRLIGKGGLG